jgi:hypothetical protein
LRDFRDPEADAAEGVKGGALPQMLPQCGRRCRLKRDVAKLNFKSGYRKRSADPLLPRAR